MKKVELMPLSQAGIGKFNAHGRLPIVSAAVNPCVQHTKASA